MPDSNGTTAKGVALPALFFALLAAAGRSVREVLLLLAITGGLVLLTGALFRLLRPLASGAAPWAAGLFAVALAACAQMGIRAFCPAAWPSGGLLLYYPLAFLAGLLAVDTAAYAENLAGFGGCGAALLVPGALREYAAAGQLAGLTVPGGGWSEDFAQGGLGLLLAGLTLAVIGRRYPRAISIPPGDAWTAGIVWGSIWAAAGLADAILCRVPWPEALSSATLRPLWLVLLMAGGAGLWALADRRAASRACVQQAHIGVLGLGLLLPIAPAASVGAALGRGVGGGLLAGLLLAVAVPAADRLRGPGLPASVGDAPILLISAGIADYAFRAF